MSEHILEEPVRRFDPVRSNQLSLECQRTSRGRQRPATRPIPVHHTLSNIAVSRPDHNNGGPVAAKAPADAAAPCAHPGNARSVSLQPVFFKASNDDKSPTGASWTKRFNESNRIWKKIGITFTAVSAAVKVDAVTKTSDAKEVDEVVRIGGLVAGDGIEVFVIDNDIATRGGATTLNGGGASAQIMMSDRGTSATLLAHELGHVLGIDHPGEANGGDANTIMAPSGSRNTANSTRNTMGNYGKITWPAAGAASCLNPDT